MDKTFRCCKCNSQKVKHYGRGMCKKCYARWYQSKPENRKKHADYERNRRLSGKSESSEKKRSKSQKRKDWQRTHNQEYYAKNRERLIAYQREYRRKNMEKVQIADRIRKQSWREDIKHFSVRDWHNVLEQHEWKCFYCHKELDNPERDHMIPISRGGRSSIDNIVPTCHICNCRKNDRTVDEYREYLVLIGETPLF